MVMKFFGGGAKKEEKKTQQQQPQTQPGAGAGGMTPQELQQQQTLVKLTKQLAESKERIDNQYVKIEKQEEKIKTLIAGGKRTEAKRQLMTFKMLQDELMKSENLVTTLEKAKVQLEASLQNKNMMDALKNANEIQKQLNSDQDQFQDILMDRQELEQDQKEITDLISQLANGTEEEREEIDDLYKQFEQQVFEEKALKVNTNPVNVNVNTNPKIAQPIQQQPQIQKPKQIVEDPLDELLQQSAQYS